MGSPLWRNVIYNRWYINDCMIYTNQISYETTYQIHTLDSCYLTFSFIHFNVGEVWHFLWFKNVQGETYLMWVTYSKRLKKMISVFVTNKVIHTQGFIQSAVPICKLHSYSDIDQAHRGSMLGVSLLKDKTSHTHTNTHSICGLLLSVLSSIFLIQRDFLSDIIVTDNEQTYP